MSVIRESDLYPPLRDWLAEQGYAVRGEVKDCDIAAAKDGAVVAIELKTAVNLRLLEQACERQRGCDAVYVAVPYPPRGLRDRAWRRKAHLLRRLELGLLLVDLDATPPRVHLAFHPTPCQRQRRTARKRALLEELNGRTGDHNVGGSAPQPRVTAYRERALHIAVCLAARGPLRPRDLRALGTGPKTQSILAANHYGWFQRIDYGVYDVTPAGRAALETYAPIAEGYRAGLDETTETE